MKQETVNVKKGGSFLIEETGYDQVFTPEDFTDEHKNDRQNDRRLCRKRCSSLY